MKMVDVSREASHACAADFLELLQETIQHSETCAFFRLCAREKSHELIVHDVCTLYFHDQLQYPQKLVPVLFLFQKQAPVSTKDNRLYLGYIGDGKLPSYVGIVINHYKDPY